MTVLIAALFFLASGVGLGVVLSRKLPELKALPEEDGRSVAELKHAARTWVEGQRSTQYAKSPDLLLEKALSTARVASLRAEAKTGELLERLRQRSKERLAAPGRTEGFEEGYWRRLRQETEEAANQEQGDRPA